jgi:hypothetical protein
MVGFDDGQQALNCPISIYYSNSKNFTIQKSQSQSGCEKISMRLKFCFWMETFLATYMGGEFVMLMRETQTPVTSKVFLCPNWPSASVLDFSV